MTLKEFYLRATNISFQLSRAKSFVLASWRSVARDEFSVFYRIVRPYTLCCNTRLFALYSAIKLISVQNLPGDIVECGTARGGSAALMGLTLKSLKEKRVLWLFDSFEGIPEPTENDPDREIAQNYTGEFKGEQSEVESLLTKLDIRTNTKLVKGLFHETLEKSEIKEIALLHVDGDWYDSVMECLECLYDQVSIGGVIQFDDYGYWEGARKAVHDFMDRYNLNDELIIIDYEGRQWIKSRHRNPGK